MEHKGHKGGKMSGGMKLNVGGDQHSTMMSKEMQKVMNTHMKDMKDAKKTTK